jgi:hypothetical protein
MDMILKQEGVGAADNAASSKPIMDSAGTGMLPIQAEIDGAATFRVLAKATSEAPWREIIEAGTAGFLQSIAWVPFIRLEVTAGLGTVTLYVGEK